MRNTLRLTDAEDVDEKFVAAPLAVSPAPLGSTVVRQSQLLQLLLLIR
jgi:hypothetical protein